MAERIRFPCTAFPDFRIRGEVNPGEFVAYRSEDPAKRHDSTRTEGA